MNKAKRTSYLMELRNDLIDEGLSCGMKLTDAETYATTELLRYSNMPGWMLRFLVREARRELTAA